MRFEIGFFGHESVRALHERTIEVTRGGDLTPAGDCVIGVGASCACAGLPEALKARLRDAGAAVAVEITVGGMSFGLRGRGDPALALSDARDIVLRRSAYACPRTLAVECDAASDSVPREMVRALREPGARARLSIEVS
ncbi:MAG: DUF371 domain-containing protein [Thaumarchaeota archaeon]|nr:DUF371 domain-containing protein [Nitrososphaerota archaeon]MDD9843581.1 DUF371 domain-containing protein [Nitrososphaerota archaeon]